MNQPHETPHSDSSLVPNGPCQRNQTLNVKKKSHLCDGLHRRALLPMGAAGVCGLTLADSLARPPNERIYDVYNPTKLL